MNIEKLFAESQFSRMHNDKKILMLNEMLMDAQKERDMQFLSSIEKVITHYMMKNYPELVKLLTT